MYTVKENTDARIMISATTKVGLEANTEKTNDTITHDHQNASKYHSKIMSNNSLNVWKFTHLLMLLRNRNSISENIKEHIKFGHV